MVDYFESRKRLFWNDDEMEKRVLTFPVSGRQRYLSRYTVACNTPFQGIAADGAKEALIKVWEECMSAEGPLSGCYPILFVHDEIVLEVPEDIEKADAAAKRLGELMVQGMEIHTPDIPAVADACLSKVWTKDAESEIGEDGLLSVYQG
jgi:DNA polymerase I-like protein with 3'-5' exonuclease and polymerase domains